MSSAVIDLRNVCVELGGHIKALQGISVALPGGQIIGCIGPSGAGKTTLIRSIVGRQRLKSGSITILGQAAGSRGLRSRLSYMTQEASVYPDLTVQENLRYFATVFGVPATTMLQTIQQTLQTVDMTQQANQLVGSLSGGQKQRVSLAIALIGEPEVMVLDEPTVGLDPVLREQLWELFRRLAKAGTTLMISSHVMDEAERCDDLLLIREGKLLAHGSPRALCRQTGTESVEQSFLALVAGAS